MPSYERQAGAGSPPVQKNLQIIVKDNAYFSCPKGEQLKSGGDLLVLQEAEKVVKGKAVYPKDFGKGFQGHVCLSFLHTPVLYFGKVISFCKGFYGREAFFDAKIGQTCTDFT